MATDVGIRFGIQGENETKNALKAVNSQVRNLTSEMRSVIQAFAGMEDSEEAVAARSDVLQRSIAAQGQKVQLLTSQYDRSRSRLQELESELERVTAEFGENSIEAARAQNAYNRQAQAVNNLASEINRANADLTRMERELNDIGRAADDVAEEMDNAENSASGFAESFKGAFLGGSISGAVQSLVGGIQGLIEETQEYQKILGTLETSSQKAGYSAEQTEQSYKQLYGVLGDEQTAATALANLQALGLSQEQLTVLTDAAIGAWATYGDSIPIDGLAEAINETVKAGAVTGTFADVLNWAGTSEDDFNTKLEKANSESERMNLVMQELASQGLPQAAEAWRQNNDNLVQLNQANANLQESTAALAELLTPFVVETKNGIAEILQEVVQLVEQGSPLLGLIGGVGGAIAGMGLSIFIGNIVTTTKEIGGLKGAFGALNTVMRANPIGIVITLIAALSAGLITAYNTNEVFRQKVDAAWTTVKQTGQEVFGTIKNGVTEAIGAVEQGIEELKQIPEEVIDIGSNIVEGIWEGITSGKDWLLGNVKEWCGSILDGIKGFFGIHSPSTVMRDTVGVMLGEGMAEGITASTKDAEDAAKVMAEAITTAASTPEETTIGSFGPETFIKTVESLKEQEPTLQEYLVELMLKILEMLQEYQPDYRQTGKYLMDGVAQGIRDGKSGVVNEVKAALEAAAQAAREAMDINSPSGVFAEIGDYMAQGLDVGFVKRMKTVGSDIASTVKMPAGMIMGKTLQLQGATNYSYGGISIFIDRVDNGNGRNVETLAKELEFYRRQQTSGKGGKV